ncbi:MAG: hypothetical protein Kow00109_30130 [Acidobacteriota bacterium]
MATYWILTGSSLALLIPDLEDPFPSFRFFALFLSHWIPLTGALVLLHAVGWKPSQSAPYRAFLVLLFWAVVVAHPLNSWLGANYLFTAGHPDVDFFLVDWLPSPPLHLILIGGFFLCLFLWLDRFLAVRGPTGPALEVSPESPSRLGAPAPSGRHEA